MRTPANERLPSGDYEVLARTDCGKVFVVICWMDRKYNSDGSDWEWERSWVEPAYCREMSDQYTITHWMKIKLPSADLK